MIKVERIYASKEADGSFRVLVDRLWPRGLKKDALHLDAWMKEVAPSTQLRQWYAHDAERWEEFKARYFAELDAHPDAWQPLLEAAGRGDVTLLYAARSEQFNHALALREYLEARLG